MKTSIASYAFHGLLKEGKMDVFGYLESVRHRYGLNVADIWNGMLKGLDEAALEKVREAMDEKEMTLVNLCVDGAHIWDEDETVRAANRQNALWYLRAAVTLGAKSVRIDMGGKSTEMTARQLETTAEGYREYAAFAMDHGFKVGPENHFGPALTTANMMALKDAVASPAFGFLLHIGHWEDQDPDQSDAFMAPWCMHTHVDQRTCENNLEAKLRQLLNAGYRGYWGIEHHSAVNEYTEVAWQLATARRALARIEGGAVK